MKLFILLIVSFVLILTSCESFQDGPLAVDQTQENFLKPNQEASIDTKFKVCKAEFEGCQIGEICWNNKSFNLPDFKSQPFTITSVEICIISDNETANLCTEMFGQTCNSQLSDCQLATTVCWDGEYPEEHPFYNGFNIQISSSELLENVEAVCSIAYTIH